jgi:hypothetical protein
MKRRVISLITTATLAFAGLSSVFAEDAAPKASVSPADRQEQRAEPRDSTPASLPSGIKPKDNQSDNKSIRETFEDLTEAAVEENAFDDLVERLVDQDRNRIGKFAKDHAGDLNAIGQRIKNAWHEKYKDNFEFDADADFKNLPVVRGEISDAKQVATHWPVPAVSTGPNAEAIQASARQEKTSNDNPDLNSNIENGREVAIVTIPASHGLPALNVSLVKELHGYRVDAPNTLTGQQLSDNLIKHMTEVAEHPDQWPADRRDAANFFAHHVMMAVYDVNAPTHEKSAPQTDSGRKD